jgi:hypothetical protein
VTTQRQQVIRKMLVSGAIAVGSCFGAAAPASAEENPGGTDSNPFGTLRCSCHETAPSGSPEVKEEIDRGLREGRSAWLPGLPAPTQPRQPMP